MSRSDPEKRTRGPVVVIAGPTASGKSQLAIELALRLGGEIVNADSMQVYRFMDIGTGKPSRTERARVPHHLFDVVAPDERYSAGRYAQEARDVVDGILARGRLPILAGGTGLYIRAFCEGLIETGAGDSVVRQRLEGEHAEACREGDPARLHRRLAGLDPEAAASIHPHDLRRTVRALEIVLCSGQPASSLRKRHGFGDRRHATLQLVLDPGRETLYEHIDTRCREMIDAGLLQEVRALRERGYGPDLAPMRAIGYRHIQPVVDGSDTLANALTAMQRDTRRFARRQLTWWRPVPDARWFDPRDREAIVEAVSGFVTKETGRAPGDQPSDTM